jgi:alpha-tubulin suppressor-like RCC1 family protein
MNPIPARRARQGALLALLAGAALLGACDGFFVEPGAPADDTGSLGLSLSAAGSGASTLLQSSNLLRVQLVRDGVVALDTVLDVVATDADREVVLPLARALTPATVLVEVELRTGRQAVLRGTRSVQLSRRQVTTAEVDLVPTASPALAPIAGISAGIFHSCALRDDGRAVCWGDGLFGQLGDGGTSSRLTPVAVGGGRAFRQVHAGFVSSCGLGTDRFAYCWGENDRGVLGIGDAARAALPTRVAGEIRFESLTMGGLHTCGLDADGRAFCWGYNRYGQLGNGTVTDSRVPVAAAPALRFRSLSAGFLHTCGVAMDRRTLCWGYNEYGQLGNGSTVDRTTPVQVSGLPAMETVDAGGLHTCSVAAGGSAHCWGYNRWGQLGSARRRRCSRSPCW